MSKIVGLTFDAAAKKEKYTCPFCGKEYKSKDALDKHINEKHKSDGEQSDQERRTE